MRIFYLADSYVPSRFANSIHVVKMSEALADAGHEVFLLGLTSERSKSNLFHHYGVKKNFLFLLNRIPPVKGALFLHAILNSFKIWWYRPDLVFGRSFISMAVIGFLFPSVRLAFETHSPVNALNRIQRWAFFRILKRAVSIVVISDALKRILVSELVGRYPAERIKVHHDGATLPPSFEGEAHQLILPDFELHVGYVGTIQKGRGIEILVELSAKMPRVAFHIVGGTQAEATHSLGLEKIPNNLLFHGYQNPAVTQLFRNKFDILVAPYQEGTSVKSGINTSKFMSPLKIFEYMATGKPIIASDLPVVREVLTDGNSLLVHPSDSDQWKRAVVRLYDSELRKSIGAQAKQDWQEKYTWAVRARRILLELNQVI